ncbi:MAG: hypothetical protein CL489_16735 [Acidobacteria bacterium]|nr:hypothetical protein [Acidobacteriota bacterium]|tara:strand:- start:3632 stop:3880 length:249 start_codon:yes stop_codon:yes gene_type:complete
MSVWFHPKAAYATPWTFTLRDGDSSGDVIFESDVIFTLTGLGVRGNGPFSFVRNGILFNNGLNAKGAAPGIKSVTVTYIGGG